MGSPCGSSPHRPSGRCTLSLKVMAEQGSGAHASIACAILTLRPAHRPGSHYRCGWGEQWAGCSGEDPCWSLACAAVHSTCVPRATCGGGSEAGTGGAAEVSGGQAHTQRSPGPRAALNSCVLVPKQWHCRAEPQGQPSPTTHCHWLGSRASRTSWRQLEQITAAEMLQNEGVTGRSHD